MPSSINSAITPARSEHAPRRQRTRPADRTRVLLRFADQGGGAREVVAQRLASGGMLVIDRAEPGGGDERLLAHLAPDEPFENAVLAARCYAQDGPRAGRPRRVLQADRDARPEGECEPQPFLPGASVIRCRGAARAFRLGLLDGAMSIPELRWTAVDRGGLAAEATVVSLREVIASVEAYEPALRITAGALAGARATAAGAVGGDAHSCSVLRQEHARVCSSPIVLNRGLREAVLAALARGDTSMSEIAIRCGRVKRDRRGNVSGETSWLARRIGLLAEGGAARPTPWIHTDVLALIARRGLALSPREVEL
ncbi:MAG TPA: hypothetical protein VFW29_08920 [Solirubrobacteraceae bacterium]|nr:hypothetical protein [Solirubrobacteraceae bacterium]